MKRRLHIDIETYSSVDIKSCGAYKYIESPDFEILLIAYAFDNESIKIIDLASSEKIPSELEKGLLDPETIKCAHNAVFERKSFERIGFKVPISEWYCSAIKAAYCGWPLKLEFISKAMKLEEKGKLSIGKALIKYFCSPCKPSKVNGGRTRNLPEHDPEKWNLFKLYCINDVEAEREIMNRLESYCIPEFERTNYIIDQEINDAGVLVDTQLASNAVDIDNKYKKELTSAMEDLTGVDNPGSVAQLKEWLSEATGKEIKTLSKASVAELIDESEDEAVSDVLKGRQGLSKSSTKKYTAFLNCVCADGRAHGLFQFYGASRTGRWAGRLAQLHNLAQNHMPDLDLARQVVRSGDFEMMKLLYDSIPNTLSELIRTALIAPKGCTFAVADFSAIEARVLSYIAQEDWRLDVFRTHGKIYEASAAMMFNVPIESIKKGSELRQRGKVAELALGYQGASGAIEKMDKDKKIPPAERDIIVRKWRKANPKIVKFWYDVEACAKRAIKTKKAVALRQLVFNCDENALQILLPSGRSLYYCSPKIGVNRFGSENILYKGMDQTTKQWKDQETYGGKLTENIVQAIARDILAYAMQNLRKKGYKMVMHVHDEVIIETPASNAEKDLRIIEQTMGMEVPWALGLPLIADGYTTTYYKKD